MCCIADTTIMALNQIYLDSVLWKSIKMPPNSL